jgi:hypothetical protein
VWQTPIPDANFDFPIRGIGIVHGYIVVTGSSPLPPNDQQLVVRIFDEHGTLLLTENSDHAPIATFLDHAISGTRVAAVGFLSEATGGALVRMYELQTGIDP